MRTLKAITVGQWAPCLGALELGIAEYPRWTNKVLEPQPVTGSEYHEALRRLSRAQRKIDAQEILGL